MKKFKIVAIALAGMSSTAYAQTTLGVTANQNAVGAVLTAPIGIPDVETQTLITAATVADPMIRSSALAQLSPQAYSLLPEIALNGVELQETNILRYVRDLRGNAERPDGSEVSTERLGRVGFFALGGARFGNYDAATDRPRVKNDNYAFMGGADFRLTPKTTIGAFGGWQQSDVDLAPGPVPAPTKLRSWFAGGFGTAGVGPVYVDFWGSYNDLDWTLNRGYAFGDTSASLSAKTDGRVWAAGVATGLSFSAGNFEIEPFATLRYADIKIDGFSESGSPAALNVSQIDAESLRLNLGGRIGTKFEAGNVTVRPQLRGGWYREFKLDDPRTISASFRSAAVNTPFAFVTSPLTNEYYNAGAALNIAGTGPVSMVVDYDVQFDDDRQFHALSLSARFKF